MTKRALTLHTGFYPQLAKGLIGKFSYRKSVSRSGGGYTYKGLGESFVEQVKSLTEIFSEQELKDHLATTTPTGFADLASPLKGRLNAAKKVLGGFGIGTGDPYREERAATWRELVRDSEKVVQTHKKYVLRGNYTWYTARSSGPKDIAQKYISANRKHQYNLEDGELWYSQAVTEAEGKKLRLWAEKELGLGKENQLLTQKDIKEMSDDVAEEVTVSGKDGQKIQSQKAKTKGSARPRDMVIDGQYVESTEQSGVSHGLVDKLPEGIEGASSGASKKKKTEMAKAWKDYMKKDVVSTWNAVVKALVKRTDNKTLDKIVKQDSKELKAEVKKMKTTGKWKSNDSAAIKLAQKMDLSFFQNLKHNIDNESVNKMAGWKEGIPISERDVSTGKRLYASTEITSKKLKGGWMKFAVKDVTVYDAVSHAHGILIQAGMSEPAAKALYLTQQQTYAHGAANNHDSMQHTNGVTTSGITAAGASTSVKFNTSVSKDVASEFFNKLQERILQTASKKLTAEGESIKNKLLTKAKSDSRGLFWASPYVGIEEGLYIKE